jgi:hypothetical protein
MAVTWGSPSGCGRARTAGEERAAAAACGWERGRLALGIKYLGGRVIPWAGPAVDLFVG